MRVWSSSCGTSVTVTMLWGFTGSQVVTCQVKTEPAWPVELEVFAHNGQRRSPSSISMRIWPPTRGCQTDLGRPNRPRGTIHSSWPLGVKPFVVDDVGRRQGEDARPPQRSEIAGSWSLLLTLKSCGEKIRSFLPKTKSASRIHSSALVSLARRLDGQPVVTPPDLKVGPTRPIPTTPR